MIYVKRLFFDHNFNYGIHGLTYEYSLVAVKKVFRKYIQYFNINAIFKMFKCFLQYDVLGKH